MGKFENIIDIFNVAIVYMIVKMVTVSLLRICCFKFYLIKRKREGC